MARPDPVLNFDEASQYIHTAQTLNLTNEELVQGNWMRGPSGTGEASFFYHVMPGPGIVTGCLAESWEMPDATTQVFHIRKGVHFHNKPPTNGRELTADDIVYSLKRLWETPTEFRYSSTRGLLTLFQSRHPTNGRWLSNTSREEREWCTRLLQTIPR